MILPPSMVTPWPDVDTAQILDTDSNRTQSQEGPSLNQDSAMIRLLLLSVILVGAQGFLGMGDKCVPVPSNLCALAYDDDGCKGWKLDIPVGEKMFKWWDPVYYWYRNDIETVSVRAGCSFTGFDDSSFNGESFTIRAGNKDRHVDLSDEDEYEDFDEAIQSYSCTCRN